MQAHLECVLQSLQQLAYARIVREFHRAWNARVDPAAAEVESREAHCRVLRCEEALAGLRLLLDEPGQIAQIKVARALYLRLLLESAPVRLQSWSDSDNLDDMPKSHLFEWIAYDFERLELAELEGAMTPDEAASYAQALDARASSLREE
jgi:hypothetical protein